MLQIVGLGAGDLKLVTLEVYQRLQEADRVFLRTEVHPAAKDLVAEGIDFESFDYLYQQANQFTQIYQEIANQVVSVASTEKDVVYALPGHPLVAEESVQLIIDQLDASEYQILAGPSFLDTIFTSLNLDPIKGVKVIDGLKFSSRDLNPRVDTIISQVYNQAIASEVKLKLMEVYPDEFKIKVLRGVGLEEEKIVEVPLYKLDRLEWIDHLTSVYLPIDKDNSQEFNRLVEIMEILRSDQGCPWDIKQDYQSLKKYLIEETYEVIERIEEEDYFGLADELGDLLLQVVFQAQIAKEEGKFTIRNVISNIVEKMVRRHPHVFGNLEVEDASDVMDNWEEIKAKEKAKKIDHLLDDIPTQLPSLLQAQKIQEKAAKVGFDWPELTGALNKVKEELEEFEVALNNNNSDNIEEELGDLIFSLVNVARFLEIDAETSLRKTIQKFKNRFAYLEDKVQEKGQELNHYSLSQLDDLWQEAKKELK
ncbi:MazG family protein [Halobacteroides halobius DSM 5150]|uniref:MazG family protein n=1 Tax=Halobacteroides halobius (strain ATCC 35273 / DSM 5150 / MD-1) TaxID=748449 RepID=L0K533_HALHC|nr:nucleoside triphosphate pyrophosphohydrolase [Halobacteroides halobius]AGB40126.1 MazG family protein [Halobacteroides halobius DSM 5150]